ncbi:MAG: regulatory iron-sulfur-containing complex subunit RicT [Synergistaceae bacterium]|nr:regulatory iron-sulfur-containing complex subunit RicT [Synergistaceae bacterium]
MSKYLVIYGKPRYFGVVATDTELNRGDVIVSRTIRGEELSTVISLLTDEQEQACRAMFRSLEHGNEGMAKTQEPLVTDVEFVSMASQLDLEEAAFHRQEEPKWLKVAKEILAEQENIEMKLVDIESLRCEKKVYFYFSAEGRVDFRDYVKELAREFKMRIELRQLSTRDSARVLGGVAACGHVCCCNYWLNQFMPVSIKMIKDQNTALNPTKISGLCGRLMCCMCFEHLTYQEAWEGFPPQGTKIKMPDGRAVVVTGIDLKAKKVRFSVPDRGEVLVAKEELESVTKAIESGEDWKTEEELAKMNAIKQSLASFAEPDIINIPDKQEEQEKTNNYDNYQRTKDTNSRYDNQNTSKKQRARKQDGDRSANQARSRSTDDANTEQKQGKRITFFRKKK